MEDQLFRILSYKTLTLVSIKVLIFFSEENECHSNLDCPHHIPCVNHFPILHTMNRALDDQLYFALKKECMPPYDPTIGGTVNNNPFHKTAENKTAKIQTDQMYMAFGPPTSCFFR